MQTVGAHYIEIHHLDGVHIVSNDHQLCLLLLHQRGDVVDPVLDGDGLLPRSHVSPLALLHCHCSQSLSLLYLGLRPVLVQQLEQLGSCSKDNTEFQKA